MTGDVETMGIARWDTRFAVPEYVFGTEPNDFLLSQRHRLQPGTRALALADGEGRNGVWLAQQGLEVLSVDASRVGLEKARKLAASRGVPITTELADLGNWEWGRDDFDVVVAALADMEILLLREHDSVIREGHGHDGMSALIDLVARKR